MSEEVLRLLANRTNQGILSLLTVEPSYPRKMADLLSLSEAEVARRLKMLEATGLVASAWSYIGKNVKLYQLVAHSVSMHFTTAGIRLEVSEGEGRTSSSAIFNPFTASVPVPEEFIGRDRELAQLAGADSVLIVEGMPGIGKTSLIARYARDEMDKRAVLWHSFRGVESLNWLANRLALFFAQNGERDLLEAVETGAELSDRRELMLQGMDKADTLFVFDDLHRIDDEHVRSYLTDAITRVRRGRLVLATRERPRFDPSPGHVRLIQLGGLDDKAVRTFLEHKGIRASDALIAKIHEEVGGHPLALNLLLEAAREADVPVEKLLDRIPERDLEAYLLQEVYEHLSEDEKRVLAHASIFRTSFTAEDMRALSGKDPTPALLKLRRRLLVQEHDGEHTLHEVVRNFFYNLLKERPELHLKAATHYQSDGSIPGRFEAMHHLLAAGRRDKVLHLLSEDLDLEQFNFIDAGYQNLYLSVLNLFKEPEVADPRRWALIEDERGDIHFHRGDYAKAIDHYEGAREHFEKAKDVRRLADLAWKRAMAQARLGKRAQALKTCEKGLAGAPKEGIERQRLEELRASLEKK